MTLPESTSPSTSPSKAADAQSGPEETAAPSRNRAPSSLPPSPTRPLAELSPEHAVGGGVAVLLVVGLLGVVLGAVTGLSVLIQLAVQVGVPLGLVGYVTWLRVDAIRSRRSALVASKASLGEAAVVEGRAFLARGIAAFGGGFYGIVAAGAFVVYQVKAIPYSVLLDPSAWRLPALQWPADWVAFLTGTVASALWDVLIDVGTGWVDGFVYAMIWPVRLMSLIGPVGMGLALALGCGLFGLARRSLPGVDAFAQDIEGADPSSFWSPLPDELTRSSKKAPGESKAPREPKDEAGETTS